MNRDNRFLRKEYLKNLFPMSFSVLGGTLNALIDGIFVSRRLGAEGLAAVNVSMPVYLVICTVGALVAGGASVLSAQAAGNENMEEAAEYYRTALSACILSGVFITFVGMFLCAPISGLLSQGGSMRQYVYAYCLVTIFGAVPSIFIYIPLYYLQLEGKVHEITVSMVLMIASDIFLDYFLMFVVNLGIYGAALASVFSTIISCVYGVVAMEMGYSNYHFRLVKLKLPIIREIARYGMPAALGNFVDAVRLFFLNAIVLYAGGAGAAAVWAVLNTLSELSLSIINGVPRAAAPMTGAYFSAHENSGLRILGCLQLQTGLALSIPYSVLIVALHHFLGVLFSIKENIVFPLLCLGIFVIIDLVSSIWTMFFHYTGRLVLSNIFVVFRKLVFPVGTAVLLAALHRYLWLFLPLSSMFFCCFGLFITGRIYSANKGKHNHSLSRLMLLDDYLEREKKVLDFSIVPDVESICRASEQIKEFCAQNHMAKRQTMQLELSIEELLTVIVQENKDLVSVDIRAFALDEETGIRIRCAGERYNPFEQNLEEDFLMGIAMMKKMAAKITYTYAMGMNTLNIMFL